MEAILGWLREARTCAFTLEARHALCIRSECHRKHLQGDVSAEPAVAPAVHLAHTASAYSREDLMRHSDIRTTMNVYGDAASAEMAEAHGRVVRLALSHS
jgi:hypothetical protein